MDLNALKLKTSSQLKDNEKQFLREHITELNDEDKAAYSDFLNVSPEPEGGEGNPEAGATGDEPSDPPAPTIDPEPTPEAAAGSPTNPDTGLKFNSEDEAKAYVSKLFDEEKAKAIAAAATPEEKRYVEETFKPKNWQEAFKMGTQFAVDEAVKEMERRQEERSQQVEAHNKKVAEEWTALRTEHKLEDITTETGRKVHDAIVDVGLKFGKKNFKDAYEVYMMIPKEKGGGYEPTAAEPTPPVTPTATAQPTPSEAASILAKSKTDAAKRAAAKVGGQNPGTSAAKGNGVLQPLSYEDLKNKSRSKILKEALNS